MDADGPERPAGTHRAARDAVQRTGVDLDAPTTVSGWRGGRALGDVDAIFLHLDGFAMRVRSGGKVVSGAAWKGCLNDPAARSLRSPVLCIIAGNAGLRPAVGLV